MTSVEDKIRELGQLAVEQLASLASLDPHNSILIRQFEENSMRSNVLINDLTALLQLEGKDSYAIFCAIIDYCQENNSTAADTLKTCMTQISILQGRT